MSKPFCPFCGIYLTETGPDFWQHTDQNECVLSGYHDGFSSKKWNLRSHPVCSSKVVPVVNTSVILTEGVWVRK